MIGKIGSSECYTNSNYTNDWAEHILAYSWFPDKSAKLYIDGKEVSSYDSQSVASGFTASSNNAKFGTYYDESSTYSGNGYLKLLYLFSRGMTDNEIKSLSTNPCQIFEQPSPAQFFNIETAGTTLEFSGSISGQSSTPAIDLNVSRKVKANIAGQSTTSDITLSRILSLSAQIAGASGTGAVDLAVARAMVAAVSVITNAAGIDLSVARQFGADIDAQSLSSAIDLAVAALGLIINPSLRSLTVQRSLVSKTVQRSVKSA